MWLFIEQSTHFSNILQMLIYLVYVLPSWQMYFVLDKHLKIENQMKNGNSEGDSVKG